MLVSRTGGWGGGAGLALVPAPGSTTPAASTKGFEVAAIIVSGLATSASLVLYARGHVREAAAIGVVAALLGTTVAVARVLGD